MLIDAARPGREDECDPVETAHASSPLGRRGAFNG
jgi:hypothetical protein